MNQREHRVGGGRAGVERAGARRGSRRFVQLAGLEQRVRQSPPRPAVVLVPAQVFPQLRDGFRIAAEGDEGGGKVCAGGGKARVERQGAPETRERFVETPLPLAHDAEIHVGVSRAWRLAHDTLEPPARIVQIVLAEAHDAEVEHRIGMTGRKPENRLELGARRGYVPCKRQRPSEVDAAGRVLGLKRKRSSQHGHRLGRAALLEDGDSPAHERRGRRARQGRGRAQRGFGLGVLPEHETGEAEMLQGCSVPRVGRQHPLERRDGILRAALCKLRESEEVQRIRVARRVPQHLLAQGARARRVPLSEVIVRALQLLVEDCRHGVRPL